LCTQQRGACKTLPFGLPKAAGEGKRAKGEEGPKLAGVRQQARGRCARGALVVEALVAQRSTVLVTTAAFCG